jgi:acetyl-CoA carboxylase carboxyl transferase alpha subunit
VSGDDARSAWDVVALARHPDRPYALDYVRRLGPNFVELHGDRVSHDDPALVAGLGTWRSRTVLFMGQQKGRTLADRVARNWGMMHPEGYRKVVRLLRQAVKFGFPVVSLVDTPGAFPGAEAEERGISQAIATAIVEWFRSPVPVVAAVIGEGGSGGALALAVADRVVMMEHAIYSVASPEAAASILWRDQSRKAEAAGLLALTSRDALGLGVVDGVVEEPEGGAQRDPAAAAAALDAALWEQLRPLLAMAPDELLRGRRQRFRRIGAEMAAGAARNGSRG